MKISGNIVDVVNRRIFQGTVHVSGDKITAVKAEQSPETQYILPGLIDAHIHIESSMLIPSEFARLAVVHGTVATVSDPHEIANVLGIEGVRFMIENGKKVPFHFYFGAPSCVPATQFETAGGALGIHETDELLSSDDILYLSEMMNFPGVLNEDPEVIKKLGLALKYGKPIDGHAPGLMGNDAKKYASAGITTDHECFTIGEAISKIDAGMKILIREGSAAKNFEALCDLFRTHPSMIMLCSDDKHPDDLVDGHIDQLIRRSIKKGYDLFDILRSCTVNPVEHYHLTTGLLRSGDSADMIIVDDLNDFRVSRTYVGGVLVAKGGKSLIPSQDEIPLNNFHTHTVNPGDLKVDHKGNEMKVISAFDGQLITKEVLVRPKVKGKEVISDPRNDILKIVVKNRYGESEPSVGFVKGFGLKKGAIASCVAHDSHNIIAVGCDDDSIAIAINHIINAKGGIAFVAPGSDYFLPLPVAGIMTHKDGYQTAALYHLLDQQAKNAGSTLNSPFMTLSFMALLVIPELKISDKGIFDGREFRFIEIF